MTKLVVFRSFWAFSIVEYSCSQLYVTADQIIINNFNEFQFVFNFVFLS